MIKEEEEKEKECKLVIYEVPLFTDKGQEGGGTLDKWAIGNLV